MENATRNLFFRQNHFESFMIEFKTTIAMDIFIVSRLPTSTTKQTNLHVKTAVRILVWQL